MPREIHLASRPSGWPRLEDFLLVDVSLPALQPGDVHVKNLFMSVDPYMRGRMDDVKSYLPPFALHQPLEGAAVGEVVASRAPRVQVGDLVVHQLGWRDELVTEARNVRRVERNFAPSAYLGVLGLTGLTAWAGLETAHVQSGDVLFVSAAAGATGSVAGQLAKHSGCRVIGSAGSPEKVRFLTDTLGFDAAFNYKDGNLGGQLKAAAPEGIDVYFDNVGGEHLEAALSRLRVHGRVIACGAIASYNDVAPAAAPRNLSLVITKRLTIKGFIVTDFLPRMGEFLTAVEPLFASGRVLATETIVLGLAQAPEAFLQLFRGGNTGKTIVKLT
jgi:NADPH-dependent curcumin reductase CurA